MFSSNDIQQLSDKGISCEKVLNQLEQIKKGFPFLKIKAAAAINNGVLLIDKSSISKYRSEWDQYKEEGHNIMKFVPASGAASRMFKALFSFLNAPYEMPETEIEKTFFENIQKFAFYSLLNDKCRKNTSKSIKELLEEKQYKEIVKNLLEEIGLNYGNLPKGLITFHRYNDSVRTAIEEHLEEGALYASSQNKVSLHFTISKEHIDVFEDKVKQCIPYFKKKNNVKYDISFSVQKSSTDTIAASLTGEPFRDKKGMLVFRPGGHGALIENLNELNADVVFIKNIDNVVPDKLKGITVEYKELLAGILVSIQKKVFNYLQALEADACYHEMLNEILNFLEKDLCCVNPKVKEMNDRELQDYLYKKLNRPIRICGVVRNQGEPGGGPFWVYNKDNSVSLQILESSQIDKNNQDYVTMFKSGTHFNPVDLVCSLKDYKGNPFDLTKFVDVNAGFVSEKSKDGVELKALELPGLWNGAMSDWNTVFVEVPLLTFNPVKIVNDLLREEHQ